MPQYLKDEVRESIVDAAMIEFYEKGYLKSSIRSIAKEAGISTGNLYRYYASKEALFEVIVSQAYEDTLKLLYAAGKMPSTSRENIENLFMEVARVYKHQQQVFSILIHGAEGTKFENTTGQIIDLLAAEIKVLWTKHEHAEFLAKPMASAIVHGLVELVESDDVETLIIDYITLITKGMMQEVV